MRHFIERLVLEGVLIGLINRSAISGMHQVHECIMRYFEGIPIHLKKAVDTVGPPECITRDIKLPLSHTRNALCVSQALFAVSQLLQRLHTFRHVDERAGKTHRGRTKGNDFEMLGQVLRIVFKTAWFPRQGHATEHLNPMILGAGQYLKYPVTHHRLRLNPRQSFKRGVHGQESVIHRFSIIIHNDVMNRKPVDHPIEKKLVIRGSLPSLHLCSNTGCKDLQHRPGVIRIMTS